MFMLNKNKWKLLIGVHSWRRPVIRQFWAAGNFWILHFTPSLNIKKTMMSEKSARNLRHSAHEEILLILQFPDQEVSSIPRIHTLRTCSDTVLLFFFFFHYLSHIQEEQQQQNPSPPPGLVTSTQDWRRAQILLKLFLSLINLSQEVQHVRGVC